MNGSTALTPKLLAFVWLGLAACHFSNATHPDSVVTRAAVVLDTAAGASHGLKLLQGPGFVLSIPDDAIVERHADSMGNPRWRVHAPAQMVTAGIGTADTTQYFTNDLPLYDVSISLGRKSTTQSLKAWGDSIVAANEAAADELTQGEFGDLRSVAGTHAYLRQPTCGDCGVYIFTFANGEQLVEIQYTTSTNEPLGMRKHGIYALILSTFRWTRPNTP